MSVFVARQVAASEYLSDPSILDSLDVPQETAHEPRQALPSNVTRGPWHGDPTSIQFRLGTSRITHKFPSDARVSDLVDFTRCLLPLGTPFHLATRVAGVPQRLREENTLSDAGLTPRGLCLVETESATTLLQEQVPWAIDRVPAAQKHA